MSVSWILMHKAAFAILVYDILLNYNKFSSQNHVTTYKPKWRRLHGTTFYNEIMLELACQYKHKFISAAVFAQ